MHIDHVRADIASAIEQEAHARQPTDGQVLAAGIEYVNVDRVASHSNGAHLDHRKRTDAGIIARILTEGTLLAEALRIGVDDTFDDEFGMRRHFEVHRFRRYDFKGLPQQAACNFQLASHAGRVSSGCEQQTGVVADHHGDLHRLLALAMLMKDVAATLIGARHETKLVLVVILSAVDAGVLNAGLWIAKNRYRGGNILSGIEFLMA